MKMANFLITIALTRLFSDFLTGQS